MEPARLEASALGRPFGRVYRRVNNLFPIVSPPWSAAKPQPKILEYWNNGIMGNGSNRMLNSERIIPTQHSNNPPFQYSNLPFLHHSILPLFHHSLFRYGQSSSRRPDVRSIRRETAARKTSSLPQTSTLSRALVIPV